MGLHGVATSLSRMDQMGSIPIYTAMKKISKKVVKSPERPYTLTLTMGPVGAKAFEQAFKDAYNGK